MAVIVTSFDEAFATGTFKYGFNSQSTTLTPFVLPPGVTLLQTRPTFLQYKRRLYILGKFSPNILVTEFLTPHALGVDAPSNIPTIAPSGSGITTKDGCIGYFTFRHKIGDRIIAESSPSPPSTSVMLSNQGRVWSNLPTTAQNPRVTHVCGYVSIDGADPRFAWERELGTTSVTENIATLALGEVLSFKRGVPTYGIFGELYHDRLWLVDAADRTKIWFSELFEPESFGTTPSNNSFTTWDGEFITGVKRHGDILLIFCRNCTYAITGWTADDLVMRKIAPSVGCISPWAIVDINGRTWFPSQDGVYFFDGQFRNMMKDLASYWRDAYLADTTNYELSVAADDRFWHTYKLLIPGTTSFYYVGAYSGVEPELEGSVDQPIWSFDRRNRKDNALGLIRNVNSRRDEVYTGSCDGLIRKENVDSNDDDDGDTYLKRLTLRYKHYFMEDPGGDEREGKNFNRLWTYVQSENNAWSLNMFGGDEWAGDAVLASWVDTLDASEVATLATPAAPVITQNGIPGGSTFSYRVVAKYGIGDHTAASPAGTIATSSAVLDGSNYNIITWALVPGAALYDVYRIVGAQSWRIATNVVGPVFNDTQFSDEFVSGVLEAFPTTGNTGKLPATWHIHSPERVSGKGLTVTLTADRAKRMIIRGFGGIYNVGISYRGPM